MSWAHNISTVEKEAGEQQLENNWLIYSNMEQKGSQAGSAGIGAGCQAQGLEFNSWGLVVEGEE